MADSTTVINTIKQQGGRITKVRRDLVELFCQAPSPVSVPEAVALFSGKAHKTTLYRELEFLVAKNILQRVDLGDQIKRYELAGQKHHHHAICLRCKKVADVLLPDLCPAESAVAQQTGFAKIKHSLEFFGLCQKCSS